VKFALNISKKFSLNVKSFETSIHLTFAVGRLEVMKQCSAFHHHRRSFFKLRLFVVAGSIHHLHLTIRIKLAVEQDLKFHAEHLFDLSKIRLDLNLPVWQKFITLWATKISFKQDKSVRSNQVCDQMEIILYKLEVLKERNEIYLLLFSVLRYKGALNWE